MESLSVPGVRFIDLTEEFFSDQRGWVTNPFRAAKLLDVDVNNLHCASLEPGAVRGNHLHPVATEWLFLFEGEFLLCFESQIEGGQKRRQELAVNGPLFLAVSPPTGHAIKNVSSKAVFILACNSAAEGSVETIHSQLLESGVG